MADAAHPQDRSSRSGLWLAAALIALAALLGALNGLGRVDQILYDRAVVMTPRPASPDILIVAIDDATIDALGRWPWRRAIHAALLDRLQGARAVGLDVIFAEPDTINPNDDAILADSLRRNGRAVLPVVLDRLDHPGSMSLPIPALAQAAAGLGFHQRAHRRRRRGARKRAARALRRRLVAPSGPDAAAHRRRIRRRRPPAQACATGRRHPDPYSGPPAHTRTVSYLSVLRGDLPANALRGKYVLVGAWATGLSDTYPTPVSHDTSGMSGVEIVANVLQAARDDIAYQAPPPWLNALFSALPALLACLALWRLSPKRAPAGVPRAAGRRAGGIAAVVVAGQSVVRPSAALLGVALSYPMWSWRSQEAALRYMDYELRRLQREYPPVLNEARARSLATAPRSSIASAN